MIKSISIENYKGYYDKQIVNFAIPDNTKNGSGLTFIVGPNNSGKTTLIEALLINSNKKFKETERHPGQSPKIVIENNLGVKKQYTNLDSGSVIEESGADHQIRFELVPSRRYWAHQFGGEWSFNQLISESSGSDLRNSNNFNLGPILRKILTTDTLKIKFNNYLKTMIPHFTEWTIDTNESNQDYIKYQTGTDYHQANLLGDGIISLFRIVAHLVHDEASTFIIDEPELSLHPTAQKRLALILSELAKSKQIIVSTHSPYFVNWMDFINGAKIIRLNKHEGKKCTTNALDNSKDYGSFISANIDAYQKPQLLDITAKEILFADKILFTEGQEDVGLIKKWLADNNKTLSFEIFGYGVGGETNMELFFEMAKDLDLEKVGGLYDSNAIKFAADKIKYTEYLLLQLPTEDIRDKTNECIPECRYRKDRVGTFTSKGILKPEFKEQFEQIMNEFEAYFSS